MYYLYLPNGVFIHVISHLIVGFMSFKLTSGPEHFTVNMLLFEIDSVFFNFFYVLFFYFFYSFGNGDQSLLVNN